MKPIRILCRSVLAIAITATVMMTPNITPSHGTAHAQIADDGTSYIVQRGDTLYSIGRRFNTDVTTLLQLNPEIRSASLIYVGMRIQLPAPASPWRDPAAKIEVFSPVAETRYHSPIEIVGYSRTFESQVDIRLTTTEGLLLGERFTRGGGVDGFDFFHTYIRFNVTEPTDAILELYEQSGPDGVGSLIAIPLTLLPGQRFIDLHRPTVGETICGAAAVSGYSLTFEANVTIQVDNRDNSPRQTNFTLGGGVAYAPFNTQLPLAVTGPTPLLVGAYEISAADGELIDWTRVPVNVYSAGSQACD